MAVVTSAAFSRVNFDIVSRTHRNGNAVKAAAYNLCGRLEIAGTHYDFSRKANEHQAHAIMLPPGAPPHFAEAGALWRAAEAAERRTDAQVARQVLISIPRECPPELRLDLLKVIAAPWVSEGAAVQLDVHAPPASDGNEQPHGHIQITLRRVSDDGLAKTKAREWNLAFREDDGRAERQRIADRMNLFMTAHCIAASVDFRSFADQGLDCTPQPNRSRPSALAAANARAAAAAEEVIAITAQLAERQRTRHAVVAVQPFDRPHGSATTLPDSCPVTAIPTAQEGRTRANGGSEASAYLPVSEPSGPTSFEATAQQAASTRRESAIHQQQETTMAARASRARRTAPSTPLTEPWMRHRGGHDALSDQLRAAAICSYERWAEKKPELAKRHDVSDYVSYVQDQHQDRNQGRPRNNNAADVAEELNAFAPAAADGRDVRRRTHLANLLAGIYEQPVELAGLVEGVQQDRSARTTTLYLSGGSSHLVDHGDWLEHRGPLTEEVANAAAAVAAAHGWQCVSIKGTAEYKDAIASACALREPPIQSDHTLSYTAAERVAQALRERAAAAVPSLNMAEVRQIAAIDPAAAACVVLDGAEARARAALSARPRGSTDPAEMARPRIADLIARRDQALADAREAVAATAAHRQAHGWTARLLDPAVRRRQVAMDDEAARLEREARLLDRGHGSVVSAIKKEARKQASSTAAAIEDWKWSKLVRAAVAELAHVERTRAAISAGDQGVIAAASRGDLRGAGTAAVAWEAARVQAITDAQNGLVDPRSLAILALYAAEQSTADPAALAYARTATAAAIAADPDTIEAAARGHIHAALAAGQQWKTAQDKRTAEQRRQRPTAALNETNKYGA